MEKHLKTVTSSSSSPTSTTFVQADPNSFKEIVQKLTGSPRDSDKLPVTLPARQSSKQPAIPLDPTGPRRRSHFKLQDRRQTMRKLEIKLSLASLSGNSPSHLRLSPGGIQWVDSPIPSPVSPLGSGSQSPAEKAITEKGFHLHPSPLSTPRASEPPKLLNLFPEFPGL
ncbi:hypothetical protein UlMin_010396 [Ulmus minor]